MLTFKQFCEHTEKLLEKDPKKGFYQLKEEMLPVFTRHHQFFVMDTKKNQMRKVLPEKIVHPDASEIWDEVPVKNTTGMRSHSKTS